MGKLAKLGASLLDRGSDFLQKPQHRADCSRANLELTGTVTAGVETNITEVRTWIVLCASGTSPCGGWATTGVSPQELTSRTLATPIPVIAGQLVQVKVLLSIS